MPPRINRPEIILKRYKPQLKKKFGVQNIGVFGSVVRNESKKGSDIDILVTFSRPIGIFKFMDLEEYLSKILSNKKIDLVSRRALKGHIGRRILKEVIYV